MIFEYQREWWMFVEPREGHSLNDCDSERYADVRSGV